MGRPSHRSNSRRRVRPSDIYAERVSAMSRADLEQLTTEDLRKRAFRHAERHADFGFFWDLAKHLPSSSELNSEDGSLGSVSDSITETVELFRNLMGKDL